MTKIDDALRKIESLATVLQDSAEAGNLDPAVYADIAEIMKDLACTARDAIGNSAA